MFKLKKKDDDEAKVAKKKELQEKKERKKREKEEKLRVKKAVQEAKKARLEDLKKDKEELYVLRKNTFLKVLKQKYYMLEHTSKHNTVLHNMMYGL